MVDKLIMEIKNKEKEHNHEQSKLHSDMNKQRKHNNMYTVFERYRV